MVRQAHDAHGIMCLSPTASVICTTFLWFLWLSKLASLVWAWLCLGGVGQMHHPSRNYTHLGFARPLVGITS